MSEPTDLPSSGASYSAARTPAYSPILLQQLWPSSSTSNSGSGAQQSQQSQQRDTASPTLSPSASFAALGGPNDQATPRASVQNNPFDNVGAFTPSSGLAKSTAGLSLDPSRRAASPAVGGWSAGGAGPPQASGLRTPTSHGFMPLPLGTPGAGQPTTGVTVGDAVGGNTGIGFGLHEPPKMRKAMTKTDGSKTPVSGGSPESSQYTESTSGTSFTTTNSSTSSSALSNSRSTTSSQGIDAQQHSHHHPGHSPRGTLSVKLISARGLAVTHNNENPPQPYVVMQFEQNEFVSSPPRPANSAANSVPFTTAQAQPVTPGNLTRSTSGLGVGTITRAFAEAVGRGKGKKDDASGLVTPRNEEGPGGGSWFGKPGPGDPVWKEEVAL